MTSSSSTLDVRNADWITSREVRAQRTRDLFRLATTAGDPEEAARALDEVVLLNVGVAESLVARYRRRGVDDDDIAAVARLALVKAVRRFDVDSGHDFLSFAAPTIRGEVKRYFRDQGWMVRPPRRIQELQGAISATDAALSTELGRSPRPSEIAAALEVDVSDVEEALAARGCFTPTSLDLPVGQEGDATVGNLFVHDDFHHAAVEARVDLGPLVKQLSERDRRVLELRFFHELTQAEIASDIGVTQMQVSRLLTRILKDLRRGLDGGPGQNQHPCKPARVGCRE